MFKCKICGNNYNPNHDKNPVQFYLKGLCYSCTLNDDIKKLEDKYKRNIKLELEYKR